MSDIMSQEKQATIKPLAKLVLAKLDAAPTKSAGGLYLPEDAAEKPKTAMVVAVGPEVKGIKPKQRIIYESYSGTEVKHQGEEYVLVAEEKVLATVA